MKGFEVGFLKYEVQKLEETRYFFTPKAKNEFPCNQF